MAMDVLICFVLCNNKNYESFIKPPSVMTFKYEQAYWEQSLNVRSFLAIDSCAGYVFVQYCGSDLKL